MTPAKIPPYFENKFMQLWVTLDKNLTSATLRVPELSATTAAFPHVVSILDQHIPSIFTGTCFNERNVPFREEVIDTELGHLFEHLVIEYLFLQNPEKTYRGLTT